MDSKSIRYQNTRLLVDSVGGVSNFADKIGKGQSQTSQFAGTNPIKGIGNKVAREIEEAFEKPYGWLDISHSELSNSADYWKFSTSDSSSRSKKLNELIIQLEYLEQNNGLTEEEIELLQQTAEILSKNKSVKNVAEVNQLNDILFGEGTQNNDHQKIKK